jgi:biotin carboxylase
MFLVLLARNPTDSVTFGLLPAAHRFGLRVRVLTDDPQAHRAVYATAQQEFGYPEPQVDGCAVTEIRSVLDAIGSRPGALLSNSDHLQTQTALAAEYFGLPGKDWRSAIRARDKGLMRTALRQADLDETAFVRIRPDDAIGQFDAIRFPAVLKPAEGVASEDVMLVEDVADLARRVAEIRRRRDGDLLVEGLIEGPLHTLETLGDGNTLRVWGGYRTTVSAAPYFIEERLTWQPALPPGVLSGVLARLTALGVGFGACHTEFIITADGPRIVEVNDRLIGDHCDFAMADLLDEPVFDDVIRVHLGEPPRPAPMASGPASPDPGVSTRHGHVHWVLATADGELISAPQASSRTVSIGPGREVRLDYRPIRSVGTVARVTGTNRDYLGSIRAIGPDDAAVEAATAEFLRTERWVIE